MQHINNDIRIVETSNDCCRLFFHDDRGCGCDTNVYASEGLSKFKRHDLHFFLVLGQQRWRHKPDIYQILQRRFTSILYLVRVVGAEYHSSIRLLVQRLYRYMRGLQLLRFLLRLGQQSQLHSSGLQPRCSPACCRLLAWQCGCQWFKRW